MPVTTSASSCEKSARGEMREEVVNFFQMNTKKSGKMQTGMEIGVCQEIPWMNDAQRPATRSGCSSGGQLAAWCWQALSVHTRR